MKAVVLSEIGPRENLEVRDLPRPEASRDHVVVKVHACGVCYRDIMDRTGKFPFIRTPIVPGHEFAGEVVEVGDGVREWSVGDRVLSLLRNACGRCSACRAGNERHCQVAWEIYGLTVDGGYAELVLAGANSLVKIPDDISYEIAATLMCTSAVALHAIRGQAKVRIGNEVLVTGASGGVGTQAIQLAKLSGAKVWAVTSSPDKVASLEALGADHVIVSTDGAFHKQIASESWEGGLDAAIEIVGSATFNASLRSLRPGGRLVLIGNVEGKRVELNPGLVILKELEIVGSEGVTRHDLETVMQFVCDGRLRPSLGRTMPLAEAAEAHRILEERGAVGRIVLTVTS